MSKKTHGFQHHFFSIFHGFGLRKRLQNRVFFEFVSKTLIFWKLAKTIEKPMVFHDFSDFRGPKNDPKSMKKRIRKRHCKITSQKSMLASILASQSVPKSFPKPSKSLQKATLNEACFATLWKLPATRRKSTEVVVCKASKWLRIWLGLLYLSIYLLICPSSP